MSYLQSGVGMSASDVTISDDDAAALVSLQKQEFKASNSQTFSHVSASAVSRHHTLSSQKYCSNFHSPHSSQQQQLHQFSESTVNHPDWEEVFLLLLLLFFQHIIFP